MDGCATTASSSALLTRSAYAAMSAAITAASSDRAWRISNSKEYAATVTRMPAWGAIWVGSIRSSLIAMTGCRRIELSIRTRVTGRSP